MSCQSVASVWLLNSELSEWDMCDIEMDIFEQSNYSSTIQNWNK